MRANGSVSSILKLADTSRSNAYHTVEKSTISQVVDKLGGFDLSVVVTKDRDGTSAPTTHRVFSQLHTPRIAAKHRDPHPYGEIPTLATFRGQSGYNIQATIFLHLECDWAPGV
jgi:hypothetical protein